MYTNGSMCCIPNVDTKFKTLYTIRRKNKFFTFASISIKSINNFSSSFQTVSDPDGPQGEHAYHRMRYQNISEILQFMHTINAKTLYYRPTVLPRYRNVSHLCRILFFTVASAFHVLKVYVYIYIKKKKPKIFLSYVSVFLDDIDIVALVCESTRAAHACTAVTL